MPRVEYEGIFNSMKTPVTVGLLWYKHTKELADKKDWFFTHQYVVGVLCFQWKITTVNRMRPNSRKKGRLVLFTGNDRRNLTGLYLGGVALSSFGKIVRGHVINGDYDFRLEHGKFLAGTECGGSFLAVTTNKKPKYLVPVFVPMHSTIEGKPIDFFDYNQVIYAASLRLPRKFRQDEQG